MLVVESIESKKLEQSISLLQKKIDETADIQKKPKIKVAQQRCKGGCGFWGKEEQDFYCSVCYRKKNKLGGVTSNNKDGTITKCVNSDDGCTYFGSPKFNGKCSVCNSKETKNKPRGWKKKFRMAQIKFRAVYRFKKAPRLKQTNKKRCWKCRRRVGITGIECRCGYIFCGKHRYAEEHGCDYDHQKRYINKLKQQLLKTERAKFNRMNQ